MTVMELKAKLDSQRAAEQFSLLYGSGNVESARRRYKALIDQILGENALAGRQAGEFPLSGENGLWIFSAPGRTELGGNHTDHNCGKVLAASIQLDNIAIVQKRRDQAVFFRSTGFPDVKINLADADGRPDLEARPEERGKTESLVRGIAAGLHQRGVAVGGFSAYASSTVLPGSGLSSSAAVEVLLGRIFDCLYGDGSLGALEIAQTGQTAENTWFGKPCGLMDQAACASGGVAAIDFGGTLPRIRRINFNLAATGFALCVINTGDSHADLIPDYAAIPAEMKAIAAFFGKTALAELDRQTVLSNAAELRKTAGDRALLRSLHFFDENERVEQMAAALDEIENSRNAETKQRAFESYLDMVNESGESSSELLQNIYSPRNPKTQALSTALILSKKFFQRQKIRGVCRVHGGGFAGTIQAYVPLDAFAAYSMYMESIFGADTVTELRIRPLGAVELEL